MSTARDSGTWASLATELKIQIIEEALEITPRCSSDSYVTRANFSSHMARLLPLLLTSKQTSDIASSVFYDNAVFQLVAEDPEKHREEGGCNAKPQNSTWNLSKSVSTPGPCILPPQFVVFKDGRSHVEISTTTDWMREFFRATTLGMDARDAWNGWNYVEGPRQKFGPSDTE
ncbi:uncharacterized protein EI97DRAFT_459277 [Westerdykella ornata]|uniref:Uncharacterized protein n=1 Tax=Westerdykella ornata TaxID=318751 RepID=A0A6A6JIA5_WESOR|nr:uncharacterized protein EI97DRAFT_459277 [Westerdykella ornata]KAF2275366.1 hypothetical protein EI97DRAFT_459277 [Westerdykella ornata]